jgi:predicted nucleic acid-binding protein
VRVVVCDTGPILHLREAATLDLLAAAGEVIIPPAVEQELETRLSNWSSIRPGWLQVARVSNEEARHAEEWMAIGGLGLGESEAIALARLRRADWLLTDDAGARVVASLLGLEVHGSLGVILWAAASGHLQRGEAFSVLERLAKSSLWISPAILNEARRALERLFS